MHPILPILRIIAKVLSFMLYALTIAAAYGGRVPPLIWPIPSIITLALPYAAILTLCVAAAWLISRRWFTGGLGIATLVICSSPILTAVPLGHERSADDGDGPEFSLMTYNILHGDDLTDTPERNAAISYLIGSDADIIALQELSGFSKQEIPKLPESQRDSLFNLYPYRIFDGVHDLMLLSKFPAKKLANAPSFEGRSSFQAYEVNIKGHKLTIVNVHLASYALDEQQREIVDDIKDVRSAKASISQLKGAVLDKLKEGQRDRAGNAIMLSAYLKTVSGPLIVCGDFNDVPESWAYRTVKGDDLRDAYAETNFGPTITFNLHHFYFHLDQILYGGNLKALKVKRMSTKASDHYPQEAIFTFTR